MRGFDVGFGALVVLHGHGDEPSSAREWGRRIAPSGWEVVAPGAPRDEDGRRSWFATGPRGADPLSVRRSVDRISDLVDRLRSDHGPVVGAGRPMVVVGFSQGGALALLVGASQSSSDGAPAHGPPTGVASICGFLPEVDASGSGPLGVSRTSVPMLLLAARDDEVVPPFMSEDAASVLATPGRSVTSAVLPGRHAVSETAAAEVRRWISEVSGRRIRASLSLPVERVTTGAELVSGEAIAELAAAYERLGYHAAYVTDHPAPDDRWLAGGGHQALEPTVALSAAAVATRHLLLHTNVYVLPYRNPFLAAKALASLDVVSGGRLIVGVAAGYLRPEFSALGVDFGGRTERLEDALRLLPRIWAGSSIAAAGPGYDARSVRAEPRPVQRPHPPIWVGGNSRAAMRRAVTLAQGWSPFPTPAGLETAVRTAAIADLDALRRSLGAAAELCEEAGRTEPLTICFVPFALQAYLSDPGAGLAPLVEEVAELEALGVDWIALAVPGSTRHEVTDHATALADALGLR